MQIEGVGMKFAPFLFSAALLAQVPSAVQPTPVVNSTVSFPPADASPEALKAPQSQQITLTIQAVPVTPPGTTGEVYVSFTPQGAEALKALTGKKIKGIGLISISACSSAAQTIHGQTLKQWGRLAGVSWIDGPASGIIESRTAANSWAQLGLDLGVDAPSVLTGLMASRIISANTTWGLAAGGAAVGFAVIRNRLQSRLPDPAKLAAVALPASITIPAGGCATPPGGEYLQMIRFTKAKTSPINLKCAGWACTSNPTVKE